MVQIFWEWPTNGSFSLKSKQESRRTLTLPEGQDPVAGQPRDLGQNPTELAKEKEVKRLLIMFS